MDGGNGMILFSFLIGGMIGYFIAALMFMAGRGDDKGGDNE